MMFLMSEVCKSHDIGMFEWLFTESGHGKGAPDGVGASVKRMADNYVAQQRHSILSARDIASLLRETKIKAHVVSITGTK